MSVTFQVERMRDIDAEIKPLHVANWAELEALRPEEPFNPDYERFFALEEAGCAVLTTARRAEKLIGYCSFYLNRCLWTGTRYASGDLLYLVPEERRGWLAVRLFDYAHDLLKQLRIPKSYGFARPANQVKTLMEYVGYEPTGEQRYVRKL